MEVSYYEFERINLFSRTFYPFYFPVPIDLDDMVSKIEKALTPGSKCSPISISLPENYENCLQTC